MKTLKLQGTMVENRKKHRQNSNLINHFPTSNRVSERANEWAVRAKERTDERVAQHLRLYSCLFQTTVQWCLIVSWRVYLIGKVSRQEGILNSLWEIQWLTGILSMIVAARENASMIEIWCGMLWLVDQIGWRSFIDRKRFASYIGVLNSIVHKMLLLSSWMMMMMIMMTMMMIMMMIVTLTPSFTLPFHL